MSMNSFSFTGTTYYQWRGFRA